MTSEEYQRILLSTWAMTEDATSTYWHHAFTVQRIAFTCDEEATHRLEVELFVEGAWKNAVVGCHFAIVGKKISVTHVTIVTDKEGRYSDSSYGNIVLPNKLHSVLIHEDMLYRVTLHLLNVFDVIEGTIMRGEEL